VILFYSTYWRIRWTRILIVFSLVLMVNCSTAIRRDAKPELSGVKLNIYLLGTDTQKYLGQKQLKDDNKEFAEIDLAIQNSSDEPQYVDFRFLYNESKKDPALVSIADIKFCCSFGEVFIQKFKEFAMLSNPYILTLDPGQVEKRSYYFIIDKGEIPKELTFYNSLNNGKDGLEKIGIIRINKP